MLIWSFSSHYVTLVSKAREYYDRSGLERNKAVEKAIKDCIELDILVDYLKNNASEVSNMLLQEWRIEEAKVVWQREAEESGIKKTRAEYEPRLAEKDALIADMGAEIARLKAQLGL